MNIRLYFLYNFIQVNEQQRWAHNKEGDYLYAQIQYNNNNYK